MTDCTLVLRLSFITVKRSVDEKPKNGNRQIIELKHILKRNSSEHCFNTSSRALFEALNWNSSYIEVSAGFKVKFAVYCVTFLKFCTGYSGLDNVFSFCVCDDYSAKQEDIFLIYTGVVSEGFFACKQIYKSGNVLYLAGYHLVDRSVSCCTR